MKQFITNLNNCHKNNKRLQAIWCIIGEFKISMKEAKILIDDRWVGEVNFGESVINHLLLFYPKVLISKQSYTRNEVTSLIELAWASCSATTYKEGDDIGADCISWINTHMK